MVKLLVFAILLASSPASGLLETLFRVENTCYSKCYTNFAASANHLDACHKGCDFKLLTEDCANQCKSVSHTEAIQTSCQVGCTLNTPDESAIPPVAPIAVDPVPEVKEAETAPSAPERPRSIILIRLRQRPTGDMPSMEQFLNSDPIQMFNDLIRRFHQSANAMDQSIRQPNEQGSDKVSAPGSISDLVKSIPLIRIPVNIRTDSSGESNEEGHARRLLINEIRHVIQHPREHQQYIQDRLQPVHGRVQQFFSNVRSEWNDLVRSQPKIPVWIFLCILLTSSAILWYMLMSLCRHTPSSNPLSIRAQELVFHPYEYDAYEKEKIQPDGQLYEASEPLPIKVKLSNI